MVGDKLDLIMSEYNEKIAPVVNIEDDDLIEDLVEETISEE